MKKLIDKYNALTIPVKAALWFTLSNVLLKGISFITLPLFTRILSTEEYGVVSLFQSWVSLVTIVITLNVWTGGFNVGLTKHKENLEEFASASQGLGVCICVLAIFISLLRIDLVANWFGLSQIMTCFVLVQVLFSIPVNIWTQKKRYSYSYKQVVLISVLMAIVNPLLGYIMVINSTTKDLARVLSVVLLEVGIGSVCFALNQFSGKKVWDKQIWKYLFSFNVVLIPHYLSYQILNQSDRVMIAKICSNSDAAIYSVAYNFAMLITLITSGIDAVLAPFTLKNMRAGKYDEINKTVKYSIIIVAALAFLLICIVPDVFKWLLPASYHDALYIIPIITSAGFFQFLYPIFSNIQLFYEKKHYIAIASCIGAGANVLLNYIFINIFGYVAAAYTTLFCFLLFCIMHYFFMKKVLKENNTQEIYDMRIIFAVSAIVLIASFALLFMYDNFILRYLIIVSGVLYLVLQRKKLVPLVKQYLKK